MALEQKGWTGDGADANQRNPRAEGAGHYNPMPPATTPGGVPDEPIRCAVCDTIIVGRPRVCPHCERENYLGTNDP